MWGIHPHTITSLHWRMMMEVGVTRMTMMMMVALQWKEPQDLTIEFICPVPFRFFTTHIHRGFVRFPHFWFAGNSRAGAGRRPTLDEEAFINDPATAKLFGIKETLATSALLLYCKPRTEAH